MAFVNLLKVKNPDLKSKGGSPKPKRSQQPLPAWRLLGVKDPGYDNHSPAFTSTLGTCTKGGLQEGSGGQ